MTASHASVVRFQMTPSRTMPALLTRMSSRPHSLDRAVDHCFSVGFVGYVPVVRYGGSLTCSDELDREISVLAGAFAGHRTPQVVDHNTCTVTRQLQSMTATNAMARPRDNGHLSFKHFVHASLPSQRSGIGSNGADVNGALLPSLFPHIIYKGSEDEAAPIRSRRWMCRTQLARRVSVQPFSAITVWISSSLNPCRRRSNAKLRGSARPSACGQSEPNRICSVPTASFS